VLCAALAALAAMPLGFRPVRGAALGDVRHGGDRRIAGRRPDVRVLGPGERSRENKDRGEQEECGGLGQVPEEPAVEGARRKRFSGPEETASMAALKKSAASGSESPATSGQSSRDCHPRQREGAAVDDGPS
jgi:hypothetical protein